MSKVKILAISGSLREDSVNSKVVKHMAKYPPEDIEVIEYYLHDIPLFNDDKASEDNFPKAVKEFKDKIEDADAVVFVSPEYNRSIPGVLKNAIDYATRPYGQDSWKGKVFGVMGASPGNLGTGAMHYDLKKVLMHSGAYPSVKEVMIANYSEKFDGDKLVDENTIEHINALLEDLAELSKKLN